MSKREDYRVSLVRPDGVTVAEMREYIEDAVASMKGGGNPDEAIFYLDGDTVRCTRLRKPVKVAP